MCERSVVQTRVSIDGSSFVLAPSQDIEQLCDRLEAAVTGTGRVVLFVAADERRVRALITPSSRVVISEEDVHVDSDDAVLSLNGSGSWDLL